MSYIPLHNYSAYSLAEGAIRKEKTAAQAGGRQKQLYAITALSFGIATFVLPDDIGDWVNWALYGLSGASFIVWLKGMFGKK